MPDENGWPTVYELCENMVILEEQVEELKQKVDSLWRAAMLRNTEF